MSQSLAPDQRARVQIVQHYVRGGDQSLGEPEVLRILEIDFNRSLATVVAAKDALGVRRAYLAGWLST